MVTKPLRRRIGARDRLQTTLYKGRMEDGRAIVTAHRPDGRGRPLSARLGLFNHSPTGFNWGYSGSGPAQLALAILADALRDDDRAVRLHQDFKRRVIAGLEPQKPWMLSRAIVMATVEEIERGKLYGLRNLDIQDRME